MFKIYHRGTEGFDMFRLTCGSKYLWVSSDSCTDSNSLKAVIDLDHYYPMTLGNQRALDNSTFLLEVDTAQEAYEYIQMYLLLEN